MSDDMSGSKLLNQCYLKSRLFWFQIVNVNYVIIIIIDRKQNIQSTKMTKSVFKMDVKKWLWDDAFLSPYRA